MTPGYRCIRCGAFVPIATIHPWRCPKAGDGDPYHALHPVAEGPLLVPPSADLAADPFVAFDAGFAWAAFADAHDLDRVERELLVASVGLPFEATPLTRQDRLSDALGFSASGGVWVKDDTRNVAGSHKARHLMSILLHLLAAERIRNRAPQERARLAIASCGNAALAAATLAAAARWPIEVFVPPHADAVVLDELARLGAMVTACPRRPADPPGDPCVLRFREAVARGAVPFGVQGPENGLCLDGGRTIGWEIAASLERRRGGDDPPWTFDRVFVQVGGGALATCLVLANQQWPAWQRLHAVQTAGCAPLERAHRTGRMWPWEHEPHSVATGILDDETYDWPLLTQAMRIGGGPVVAPEEAVVAANDLALRTTDIDVSPTGSAGLAGLLALRAPRPADTGHGAGAAGSVELIGDHERVLVLFTGTNRHR